MRTDQPQAKFETLETALWAIDYVAPEEGPMVKRIKAHIRSQWALVADLEAKVKALSTPDMWWDWHDGENGLSDPSEADWCECPVGTVMKFDAAKRIGIEYYTKIDEDDELRLSTPEEIAAYKAAANATKGK